MSSNSISTRDRSGLLGAAVVVTLLVTLSAFRPSGPAARVQLVLSDPPASSIVRIAEGQPYTVPVGLRLSIKSFGFIGGGLSTVRVQIKGTAVADVGDVKMLPVLQVPIVAQGGDVVSLVEAYGDDPVTTVLAFGYLSDN
jgi:hypothetical protein